MPYRIIVVDDSAFMRKIVSDLIEQDPEFQVQATAKNGREAIELIESLSPDLVTMDVEMPEMNGLDALKLIMKQHPLPVIMLSGINEQGMKETIIALELGAFDFIRKPSVSTSSHDIAQVGQLLREQIRIAMQAKERREARNVALKSKAPERLPPIPRKASMVSQKQMSSPVYNKTQRKNLLKSDALESLKQTDTGATLDTSTKVPADQATKPSTEVKPKQPVLESPAIRQRESPVKRSSKVDFTDVVAIGSSTGGPKALKAVLEKLPADFPAPIVIVQHMPPNFTKSLAQRLNSLSELNVVEAEEGMKLEAGTAYIAPGGFHMTVVQSPDGAYCLSLTGQDQVNGHRPSVDVLYDSLIPLTSLGRHAVILTGMGSDGAKGMKRLYDAGMTSTIAESEETCVVYGMPRSAIELGCVHEILPLQEIGYRLAQVVK